MISNPNVIDLVAHDPASGEYALVMVEERSWDGSEARLFELQAKTNTYLTYALDGLMAEHYPQSQGQPVRLQLDCPAQPDDTTAAFLEMLAGAVRGEGLQFVVNVLHP